MIPPSFRGYRFVPDVIQRAVWMYLRFTLSYRDVEDLLAERGIQAFRSPTKRSGAGSTCLDPVSRVDFSLADLSLTAAGTWMRFSSGLAVSRCISGERLTPKVRFLNF